MIKFKTNVFKYIIIPAIAILALLCFAPKANASTYIDISTCLDSIEDEYPSIGFHFYFSTDSAPEQFGFIEFSGSATSDCAYGLVNVEYFEKKINEYNVQDAEGFETMIRALGELGYLDLSDEDLDAQLRYYFEDYYEAYLSYLESKEKNYSQDDIDTAVSEATKDMYTEAELEEILSEARLNRGGYALYPSNVDLSPESFGYYMKSVYGYKAVTGIDSSFNYIQMCSTDVSDVYIGNEIYLIDPFQFQSFCLSHNITKYSDLDSTLMSIGNSFESGSAEKEWLSNLMTNPMSEGAFDYYYNYKGLTQEEYDASIDEAKSRAVEEYKNSDDYTSTINLAKTVGAEEYKESDAYASTLTKRYNDGYSKGLSAGELSYKTSLEHKTALEGEYNKGFDTGFVEGQKKVNVGPVIAGVCILAVVALALVIVTRKKKNKYRR